MQGIDLGVLRLRQIVNVVALYGLVQKRQPYQQHGCHNQQER